MAIAGRQKIAENGADTDQLLEAMQFAVQAYGMVLAFQSRWSRERDMASKLGKHEQAAFEIANLLDNAANAIKRSKRAPMPRAG